MYARVAPGTSPSTGRPAARRSGCPTTRCRAEGPARGSTPIRVRADPRAPLAFDHHHGRELARLLEPPPRRHVRGGVGTEHEEQLRSGAASASSVSAVTDGASRSTSTRDTVIPGTPAPRARPCARGRRRTRRPVRASATDHRRGRAAPRRGRARCARRPRRRRARGGPGRRCHRGHRGASPDDSTDGSLTVRCISVPRPPSGPAPVGRVRPWLRAVR